MIEGILDWAGGLSKWAFLLLIVIPIALIAALPFMFLFHWLGWT